jgi:hypothetical protein
MLRSLARLHQGSQHNVSLYIVANLLQTVAAFSASMEVTQAAVNL